MALLKPKMVPILGVDVSSTSIKILEFSKTSKDTYRVESYAVEPLPTNAVTEKTIQDIEAIAICPPLVTVAKIFFVTLPFPS